LIERFLAYKTGDTWNGVVGYDEYKKKTDLLETKLDLILSHLKLKYVPETKTKEPAKLVEKTVAHPFFDNLENGAIIRCPDGLGGMHVKTIYKTTGDVTKPKKKRKPSKITNAMDWPTTLNGLFITPDKKKRGRPKKK